MQKPLKEATDSRIRSVRRIAIATVSSLVAGSIVLSSGYAAVAQPTPSPSDTHTTPPPVVEPPPPVPVPPPAPEDTHTTPPVPVEPVTPVAPVPVPPPAPVQPVTPTTPAEDTCTYTIVSGDSLSTIALRLLGDGGRHPEIYAANQALIEAAARENPEPPVFGTSVGPSGPGHWIFPGTVLTLPGGRCGIARELPKLPWIKAVERCGEEIFNSVSTEVFLSNLRKAGLVSKTVKKVLAVGKGTGSAVKATIELQVETDQGVVTQTFRAAEMLTSWLALLGGEPGLIAKIAKPGLYCAEAGVEASIAAGETVGKKIRANLGLPPA